MFLNKIKSMICELAQSAVVAAEQSLNTAQGGLKKEYAIAFVVGKLPLPAFLRPVLALFLKQLIDECIEQAVARMKQLHEGHK